MRDVPESAGQSPSELDDVRAYALPERDTPAEPSAAVSDRPARPQWPSRSQLYRLNLGLSALTFLVSWALYAVFFDIPLSLGIVLLLLLHELGHFALIRWKGLPAGLPVFIPFLGAYVSIRQLPPSVRDEAEIALAGPLLGGVAALACLPLYYATGEAIFLPLAYLGFVLNLINLVPLLPLDGGRVARAFPLWFWLLALAGMAVAFQMTRSVGAAIGGILVVIQAYQSATTVRRRSSYFRVSFGGRLLLVVVYAGLSVGLLLGTVTAYSAFASHPR